MADFSIKAIFGADTSQLKADLVRAQGDLKDFKNTAEGIGLDLKKLALSTIFTGVALALGKVIDNAQKTRDEFEKMGKPVDLLVGTTARFGDAIDDLKGGVAELATNMVGVVALAGEGWGMLINRIIGVGAEQERVAGEIARSSKKTIEEIDKARARYEEDRQKASDAMIESQKRLNLESLSGAEKLNAMTAEYIKLVNERNQAGEGSLVWMIKSKELNDAELALLKEIDKVKAEDQKRTEEVAKNRQALLDLDAEMAKQEGQREKERSLSGKEYIEFLRLQAKEISGLSDDEKNRLSVLRLQTQQIEAQAEIDEILKRDSGALTDEDNARLVVLGNQVHELDVQISELSALKDKGEDLTEQERERLRVIESQLAAKRQMQAIGSSQQDLVDLSDRELAEKITNLTKSFSEQQQVKAAGGWAPMAFFTGTELEKAREERERRSNFRLEAKTFGVDRALSFYSAFDEERLMGYLNGKNYEKENNQLLRDIDEKLGGKFRNV